MGKVILNRRGAGGEYGTAKAPDVLDGKTIGTDDGLVAGTMPDRGAVNVTLTSEGQEYYVPDGRHSGLGKVIAKITNLIAGNVKQGSTVGGVAGNYTNDADATAADFLTGKTAYAKGAKITGSMADNGAVNQTLVNEGQTYTIPAGKHSGSGIVKTAITNLIAGNIKAGAKVGNIDGSFTNDADAAAGEILTAKKAYVKGALVTGSMPDNGAVDVTLTAEGQEYTVPAGKHSGLGKIIAKITNLIAGNVKSGVELGGILGTFTDDADVAAGEMLTGKKGYVKGALVTGTMPDRGAPTYTPSNADQAISAGRFTGGTVKAVAGLAAASIKNGTVVGGVTGTFPNDGTLVAADALTGKTFYAANATKQTGSMADKGALTVTPGAKQTFGAGKYSGITVNEIPGGILLQQTVIVSRPAGVSGNRFEILKSNIPDPKKIFLVFRFQNIPTQVGTDSTIFVIRKSATEWGTIYNSAWQYMLKGTWGDNGTYWFADSDNNFGNPGLGTWTLLTLIER